MNTFPADRSLSPAPSAPLPPRPLIPSAPPAARRGRPRAPRPCPALPGQDGGGRGCAAAGLPPRDRQVRPGDQGGRAGTAASLGTPQPGRGASRARAERAVVFQDIRDCPGPLSALTELNAAVKEKFRQLRGRIQVRGAEGPLRAPRTPESGFWLCFVGSWGFLPGFGVS